jgi:hypothetical protein
MLEPPVEASGLLEAPFLAVFSVPLRQPMVLRSFSASGTYIFILENPPRSTYWKHHEHSLVAPWFAEPW